MTGVYELRERESRRFPQWLTVTQVGPMDYWSPGSQSEAATEQASIPAVTTLPASDDQQAVTVRFSYPGPATATTRGTLLADGLPTGFVVEFDRAGGVWRLSGSAGDTPNSGEKADMASGFVTGSRPDRPASPKNSSLFMGVWGNMFEEKE